MSTRIKLLPAFITLLAGSITSIITFCLHYEGKTALIILLVVLLLFYILGVLLQKILVSFEMKNKETKSLEEGKVVEKEIDSNKAVGNETLKEDTNQEGQN